MDVIVNIVIHHHKIIFLPKSTMVAISIDLLFVILNFFYVAFITLFNHVSWLHDSRICQLYYVLPLNKVEYMFIIHTFRLAIENLGGVILPTLFINIIVTLCIMTLFT